MVGGFTRRQVLGSAASAAAAATAAAATVTLWSGSARAASPGEKVIVGVMGLSRGASLASTFASLPGAAVKYVCDVDAARIPKVAAAVEKAQQSAPQAVADFRRILDDKDVHALVVAAPNHWHAPASLLAMAAGKHVYCEKPCSHNPREGELLVEASARRKLVFQHGTQRRSYPKLIEAMGRIRAGELGPVHFVRSWYTNARGSIGKGRPAEVPKGLDWALWQGPAPERPYLDNIVHYNWHWRWHWGNGELGNNGVHGLDLCRWGLGLGFPRRVTSTGGRYHFEDDQETPDTNVVAFDFGNVLVSWEGRSCTPQGLEGTGFGATFVGEKATLTTDGSNGYRILDPKGKEVEKVTDRVGDAPHAQNFVDAVTGVGKPTADADEAHKSALLCHVGNIAYRLGRAVTLDEKGQPTDKEVAAQWSREYRPGWEPKA